MDKKKQSKTGKSSQVFFAFWSTLPGVLTGIAAVLAAITGLYLAFGTGPKPQPTPTPTPTPTVSPAPTSTIPSEDVVWDQCFGPEFAGTTSIEVGTGEHFPRLNDGETRIKLTDGYQPLGAVTLRHYPSDDHFEVRVIDSKCGPIQIEDPKLINDAWLKVAFRGQKYELRLMYHGGRFSTVFVRS